MIIPLVPALLTGSSDLPGNFGRVVLSSAFACFRQRRRTSFPYLVLLRAGFCLPSALQQTRCALTAPFHPYPPLLARTWRATAGGIFSVPLVLQVTLTGRYPAHYPSEFGLSSRLRPFRLRQAIIWPTAAAGLLYPFKGFWTWDWSLRIGDPAGFSRPAAEGGQDVIGTAETLRQRSRIRKRHARPACCLTPLALTPYASRLAPTNRPSPAVSRIARASCRGCCAACQSLQRSSRCSTRSREASRPATRAPPTL
jgi:hypothetical protein